MDLYCTSSLMFVPIEYVSQISQVEQHIGSGGNIHCFTLAICISALDCGSYACPLDPALSHPSQTRRRLAS